MQQEGQDEIGLANKIAENRHLIKSCNNDIDIM
jgi:hypothetical protein